MSAHLTELAIGRLDPKTAVALLNLLGLGQWRSVNWTAMLGAVLESDISSITGEFSTGAYIKRFLLSAPFVTPGKMRLVTQ
jgi:hypothetical protein